MARDTAWRLQAPEPEFGGAALYIDQDTFIRKHTDQDYTMGVLFARSGRWVHDTHLDVPLDGVDWLLGIDSLRAAMGRAIQARGGGSPAGAAIDSVYDLHAFEGGVSTFTPLKGKDGETLARSEPIYNDRPYACLAYVTTRHTSAFRRWALASDLTVGVLGLDICRAVQTWIHQHITDDVRPGGWGNQVSNGGAPTAKYTLTGTWLAWYGTLHPRTGGSYQPSETHWFELTLDGQGNAGYYTNVSAGGRLRLGLINSPFWGAARKPIGTVVIAAIPRRQTWLTVREAYAWISGGVTYWQYNALMQGQWHQGKVRLNFDPKDDPNAAVLNRWIDDWQAGATIRFTRFSLVYQYNHHSPAFGGPFERAHAWGGFYIRFAVPGA